MTIKLGAVPIVGKALEGSGFDGLEYLEKIVQVPVELPLPSRESLRRMLFEQLDELLEPDEDGLWDQHHWGNTFVDGIDHFIALPRHVRRLMNVLNLLYPTVRGEVNPVDYIGMETLRVFLPGVYDQIRLHPEMFTGPQPHGHDVFGNKEVEALRAFHEAWLAEVNNRHQEAAKALTARLFPKLLKIWGSWMSSGDDERTWRKRLRACHPEVLPAYLRLTVPAGELTSAEVRATLHSLDNVAAASERIVATPDLLPRLEDHLDDLTLDRVENLFAALLTVGDRILGGDDQRKWDMFDSLDLRLIRLLLPLTKRLHEGGRKDQVRKLMVEHAGVATATTLAGWLGNQHGRNGGEPWRERDIDEADVEPIEDAALQVINQAVKDGTLLDAPELGAILHRWLRWGDETEVHTWARSTVDGEPDPFFRFMRAFVQESRSSSAGDRVGREHFRMDPAAVGRFVDVEVVEARVRALLEDFSADDSRRLPLELFLRGREMIAEGRDPSDAFAWREDRD